MGTVAAIMVHVWTFLLVPLVILLVGTGISWTERELLLHDVASTINARPQGGAPPVR